MYFVTMTAIQKLPIISSLSRLRQGDCDVKVMLHSKILSPNENNRNVPEAKINDVTFITEKFLVSHSKGQAG